MRKLLFMMIAIIFIVSAGSNLVGDHAFEILDVSSITFFSDLLLQFGSLSSELSTIISSSFTLLSDALMLGLTFTETVVSFITSMKPVIDAFMQVMVPIMESLFTLLDTALSGMQMFFDDMRSSLGDIGRKMSDIFGSIGRFFSNIFD